MNDELKESVYKNVCAIASCIISIAVLFVFSEKWLPLFILPLYYFFFKDYYRFFWKKR